MIDPAIHTNPCAAWQQVGEDVVLEISGDWKRDGSVVDVTGTAPDHFPARYLVEKLGSYDSTLPAFILSLIRSVAAPADGKDKPVPALDGRAG